jgi:osmotically inducible protein OsmC
MAQRKGKAVWRGGLKDGSGTVELGSGLFKGEYSFQSRFESGPGTNPEELIGAAHAGCFSMALAGNLERAGYTPEEISTTATVSIEKAPDGFAITTIVLDTQARVLDIDEEELVRQAENAKDTCPVSQVLKGAKISLKARLEPAYSPV